MDQSTCSMEIDEFMSGALVTWFTSCIDTFVHNNKENKKTILSYDDLVDGTLIHNVYLQINPHVQDDVLPARNDASQRQRNLVKIFENLRQFYEEDQGQLLLRTPDIEQLAREPEFNVSEAKLLLCLLLGCAVQCHNKERFINGIKKLDELTQDDIKKYIQQVVYIPGIVLTSDMLTAMITLDPCTDQTFEQSDKQKAFERLHRIYVERNELRKEKSTAANNTFLNTSLFTKLDRTMDFEDDQVDELKAKLRAQRMKFKEMENDLMELRDALKESEIEAANLKSENVILSTDMRSLRINMKDCNDELDAAHDEVQRAHRLEQEVMRYKEKLRDMVDYKSKIDELNELNQLLVENKNELQKQLDIYMIKADKVSKLDEQIFRLNQQVNELTLEEEAWKDKCQVLVQRNEQLERQLTTSKEAFENRFVTDSDDSSLSFSMTNKSICEQLTDIEHSLSNQKALELELENRRLSNAIYALKENSFLESSSKILNLEKEKKKLSLTVEALKDELAKKQSSKDTKSRELIVRLAEFEKKQEKLMREKRQLQEILDAAQRNLDDVKSTKSTLKKKGTMESNDQVNELRIRQKELEKKVEILEEEKKNGAREVEKQNKIISERVGEVNAARKVIGKLEKKLEQLEKKMEESTAEVDSLNGVHDTDTVKMKKKSDTAERSHSKNKNAILHAEVKVQNRSRSKLNNNQQELKFLYQQLQKNYRNLLKKKHDLQKQLSDTKMKLCVQCDYSHKLKEEINNLRANIGSGHNNVSEEYSNLKDDFGKLMMEYIRVKTQTNQFTLDYRDYKNLDVKNTKFIELELYTIQEKCNILVQLNKQLTSEKKILMEDVSELIKSYRELFCQSMEDSKQYFIEDRKNNEKLNNLKGLKEKLEAKLIDQIMKSNNPNKKKASSPNIVKTTFSKVRRAGSELFGRTRRSWAVDTSCASERSYDFEYQKGTESKASLEEARVRSPRKFCVSDIGYALNKPRNRKSVDFLQNFSPNNFSFNDRSSYQPKCRMSMDFETLKSFYDNNNNEGELDRTLHDFANDDEFCDFEDSSMFSNKAIDLSFEEDKNDAESDDINNVKDNNNSKEFLSQDLSSSTICIKSFPTSRDDRGCV